MLLKPLLHCYPWHTIENIGLKIFELSERKNINIYSSLDFTKFYINIYSGLDF